ncbi:MAG: hypothetical protein JST86_06540 [Bacteroidetes bacterium]|nr:hypothetical protein [Bacteroidota bacterium]
MQHKVNILKMQTTCTSQEQALELRRNFFSNCSDEMASVMDNVYNQFCTEEEWINIQKLEIDLGKIPTGRLSQTFFQKLEEELVKALVAKIQQPESNKQTVTQQEGYAAMLEYFLQTGALPWWAAADTPATDELVQEVLERNPQRLYQFLIKNIRNSFVFRRLVYQCNDDTVEKITALFTSLQQAQQQMISWKKQIVESGILPGNILSKIFSEAAQNKMLLANASQLVVPEDANSMNRSKLETIFIDYLIQEPETKEQSTLILQKVQRLINAEPIKDENRKELNTTPEIIVAEEKIDLPVKLQSKTAGIILAAPYLKQLFTQTGLWKDAAWATTEAWHRAVHLVRFIATGEQQGAEQEMILEKLLCGMAIEMPLQKDIALSENEEREAASLLTSIIANWPQLKNTSVAGLQQTFLKRKGILEKKENDWHLTVERKTADVLLDSLPWGFSSLQLPWNNYFIFTVW